MQKTQITEVGDAFIITRPTDAQRQRLIAAMNEPAPEQDELLTRREAGKILNLHPLSLKRYDKTGLLHPVRLTSRTVRYKKSEVHRFLEGAAK